MRLGDSRGDPKYTGEGWEKREEREEGGREGVRRFSHFGRSGGEGGRVAGRVVGGRMVVILGALKWPERLGDRRSFPKDGGRGLF